MTAADPTRLNDAHCHFFSAGFFATLARDPAAPRVEDPAVDLPATLGWEAPGDPAQLADRWVAELDRHGVGRAALTASVPGDEASVAAAVARHPSRCGGLFMVSPTAPGAGDRPRPGLSTKPGPLIALLPNLRGPMPVTSRYASTSCRERRPMSSGFLQAGTLPAVPGRMSEPRPRRPEKDALPRASAPEAQRESCSRAMCSSLFPMSARRLPGAMPRSCGAMPMANILGGRILLSNCNV